MHDRIAPPEALVRTSHCSASDYEAMYARSLDDRRLSIGEVATRLGYTELPNFTRAFRKWTGVTPAA